MLDKAPVAVLLSAATCGAGTTTAITVKAILRVAGITIRDTAFENMATPADHSVAVLWGVLEQCVVPAEQRFHAPFCNGEHTDISAALRTIDVMFPGEDPVNTPILEPLVTDYPALVPSLRVLKIAHNSYDESAALGAFAVLATQLRELSFYFCGLTSVRGLKGPRCEFLQNLYVEYCKHFSSLDGIEHHLFLKEVDAKGSAITSIEPLLMCPSLSRVLLYNCNQLPRTDVCFLPGATVFR